MPYSDRAFRAMFREQPDVAIELLNTIEPALVLAGASAAEVDDPHLAPPPAFDAVVTAAMRGRYHAMIRAMETADLEPVIIEDLIRIGEDLGIEKGIEKGIERGVETGRLEMARQSLLDLIDARGLVPSDAQRARISNERALEPLRMWLRRAATADSVDDVFAGE